ncbi:MAG: NAD(P)/FAD-dependent oxidoreductase [Pseudomonadales bacterium]|nr:NAD(P)/FAD-dependent oxidoreductase [Pseudomonadales bacterium]
MSENVDFDVIIVGGGAAGLMCASKVASYGKRTLLLERTNKVGKKILMSGGGRCNFTNLDITPENYISNNPHFAKSALSRYTQWDFIGLVCEYGVAYHEKTLGQLFCDNSSKDILRILLQENEKHGVSIKTNTDIYGVSFENNYRVETSKGEFRAETVVVASGGLSIPSMGVTGFGYELAEQFGMKIIPTVPALVPFTLSGELKQFAERLSGVSLPVTMGNKRANFYESMLFTHRGLSGPAVLQLSSYWKPGESISIDLLPGEDAKGWLLAAKQSNPKSLLRTLLGQKMPKKLVQELVDNYWQALNEKNIGDFSHQVISEVADLLSDWQIKPSGTEGYRTAEVTMGGVDTNYLSSKSMESTTQPGLFFIGEVVDVTGHLGGYNFQWAWSSAYAAAQAIVS